MKFLLIAFACAVTLISAENIKSATSDLQAQNTNYGGAQTLGYSQGRYSNAFGTPAYNGYSSSTLGLNQFGNRFGTSAGYGSLLGGYGGGRRNPYAYNYGPFANQNQLTSSYNSQGRRQIQQNRFRPANQLWCSGAGGLTGYGQSLGGQYGGLTGLGGYGGSYGQNPLYGGSLGALGQSVYPGQLGQQGYYSQGLYGTAGLGGYGQTAGLGGYGQTAGLGGYGQTAGVGTAGLYGQNALLGGLGGLGQGLGGYQPGLGQGLGGIGGFQQGLGGFGGGFGTTGLGGYNQQLGGFGQPGLGGFGQLYGQRQGYASNANANLQQQGSRQGRGLAQNSESHQQSSTSRRQSRAAPPSTSSMN